MHAVAEAHDIPSSSPPSPGNGARDNRPPRSVPRLDERAPSLDPTAVQARMEAQLTAASRPLPSEVLSFALGTIAHALPSQDSISGSELLKPFVRYPTAMHARSLAQETLESQ